MNALQYKPDWAEARQALTAWWEHRGLALSITAIKDVPWEKLPEPVPQIDPNVWWYDVPSWVARSVSNMARTYWGGVAFPIVNTNIGGPGSLGLFLGAIGHPSSSTLWYEPVIHEPEKCPPLRCDFDGRWWKLHLALLDEVQRQCRGRYAIGYPDLIENIDTLAQLRDPQTLLVDLVERPEWVREKLAEINVAFFAAYDRLYARLRDPWGGSTWCSFQLWGPGRVAKVQCDFCCMISTEMFREFVVPGLAEQCGTLDYAMYHLDGTQALHQLDALLEIEALEAIEWTPQAGIEGGGSPRWYGLYRRIKAAGKSVQAIGVKLHEVEPLIEAVGPEGLYIMCWHDREDEARALLRRCGWKGI